MYLNEMSIPSLTIAAHRNLTVEFKLDVCQVLFTDILDCNAYPDNDGGYGNFGSLVGHLKNVFLTVST